MTLDVMIAKYNKLMSLETLTEAERRELITLHEELTKLQGELGFIADFQKAQGSNMTFAQSASEAIEEVLTPSVR